MKIINKSIRTGMLVYMINLAFVSLSTPAKYNIIVKLVSIYLNAKLSKVAFKGVPRLVNCLPMVETVVFERLWL